MHLYARSTSTEQPIGMVSAAGVFLMGMVFCHGAQSDRADAALTLTLGTLLLASGAVGLVGSYWLGSTRAVAPWQRTLANSRWVAGGVVIACALGAAFDPFFTVILLAAGVLFVGAAVRFDRSAHHPLLPGVGLLVAGLVTSVGALMLAFHG
ncbi:MAG TPA: hypothetical protein VNL71_16950 [Chloroflexota bacterium]|nr:hypothetical protein [Chloroflexota bacterium]